MQQKPQNTLTDTNNEVNSNDNNFVANEQRNCRVYQRCRICLLGPRSNMID